MEERKDSIENMLIKLQVLDNKIQNLKSITDSVLEEVSTEYHLQIDELIQKKEAMQQMLSQIQKSESN